MTLQQYHLDENGQGKPYAVYGYGVQMAEIEVNKELGTIKVEKITAAHDLGRVSQPTYWQRDKLKVELPKV